MSTKTKSVTTLSCPIHTITFNTTRIITTARQVAHTDRRVVTGEHPEAEAEAVRVLLHFDNILLVNYISWGAKMEGPNNLRVDEDRHFGIGGCR